MALSHRFQRTEQGAFAPLFRRKTARTLIKVEGSARYSVGYSAERKFARKRRESVPVLFGELNPPMPELERLIRTEGEKLLALGDNWDDEQAPSFDRPQIDRLANWLRQLERSYRELLNRTLALPGVAPVNDGSIDLFWAGGRKELLVNIPRAPDQPITFHGRAQDDPVVTTTGRLGSRDGQHEVLVGWLLDC